MITLTVNGVAGKVLFVGLTTGVVLLEGVELEELPVAFA